jgi:hypothetical protein
MIDKDCRKSPHRGILIPQLCQALREKKLEGDVPKWPEIQNVDTNDLKRLISSIKGGIKSKAVKASKK